jgi:hypothetical protein
MIGNEGCGKIGRPVGSDFRNHAKEIEERRAHLPRVALVTLVLSRS